MSLMEFAIVNNYMGPVATKMMKGYSEENLEQDAQTNGRGSKVFVCMHMLSVLCKTVDSMDFDIRPPYFVVVAFFFLQRKSIDHRPSLPPQYDTFCNGRETALYIDKFSRFFFPFSFVILNILYWTTFL